MRAYLSERAYTNHKAENELSVPKCGAASYDATRHPKSQVTDPPNIAHRGATRVKYTNTPQSIRGNDQFSRACAFGPANIELTDLFASNVPTIMYGARQHQPKPESVIAQELLAVDRDRLLPAPEAHLEYKTLKGGSKGATGDYFWRHGNYEIACTDQAH